MRKVHVLSILAAFLLATCGCHGKSSTDAGSASTGGSAESGATAGAKNGSGAADDETAAGSQDRLRAVAGKNDHRPVLVCFGDSLTAGLGMGAGQSYPDDLQADLDKRGYRYRVDNEGVSGNTTKDGVERLPEVLALHPTVAVVEFGGNDGLRGVPIADTRANLDKIVGTLQGAGVKVAVAGITLPPDYGPDYIGQFDETYVLLAKKYHVPMLPFLLKDVYGVPGMMQGDGIHATANGNVVVARNVETLVVPLLKK